MPRVSIRLLEGSDPLAGDLAERHAAEWGSLYGDWDRTKAVAEFRSMKTDGSLPATLVLREDGRVGGTVSLLHGDCEARRDLDPWLASLYVFPQFRGRGYADRLIGKAIRVAATAGEKELHVFTESAAGLFRRHGFAATGRCLLQGRSVFLLRLGLP